VFARAEAEASALIREIQKQMREQGGQSAVYEARRQLTEKTRDHATESLTKTVNVKLTPIAAPVERNRRVYVGSFGKTGVVVEPPDGSGDALVQMGVMKMKVNVSDLYEEPKETKKNFTGSVARSTAKSARLKPEIDLRGMMTEEGSEACDKYIDDAYLSSLDKVTVIHGKGTGALRSAIHARLNGDPRVASFRLGRFGEGEDGVTIVELKKDG